MFYGFRRHQYYPPWNADASYTQTLQQYCEWITGKYGERFDRLSDDAISKIFDFDYVFWSENSDLKREFETDFLRHFFMRELGYETPALWKLKLEDFFKLWMPYYSRLMEAAIKSANLDWTLTDDYYIDYQRTSANTRDTNSNNTIKNMGSDTREVSQNTSQELGSNSKDGGNIKDTITRTGNRTGNNSTAHGGSDTENNSGSTTHNYNKATVRTDTPQDRFTQGGTGNQYGTDVLNVAMDYATDINRENYSGTDTDTNKMKTTNYNSTVNDTINEENTENGNNTRELNTTNETRQVSNGKSTMNDTLTKGTTTEENGNKKDIDNGTVHEITHEAGRRGVAWIDIYEKYMNAIRNIQNELFNKADFYLFMQVWG